MANTYSFGRQRQIGKIGEDLVYSWLKANYYMIEDVRDNKEWQKKDIDFLITENQSAATAQVDVKTDTYYYTGNYFFETWSNKELEKEGCFITSAATYWFYLYVPENELHIIPLKEVRKWFNKNKNKYKVKTLSTRVKDGAGYTSEGVLVPRVDIKDMITIIKLTNE